MPENEGRLIDVSIEIEQDDDVLSDRSELGLTYLSQEDRDLVDSGDEECLLLLVTVRYGHPVGAYAFKEAENHTSLGGVAVLTRPDSEQELGLRYIQRELDELVRDNADEVAEHGGPPASETVRVGKMAIVRAMKNLDYVYRFKGHVAASEKTA